MTRITTLMSFVSGRINGNYNLILTQLNRPPKFYFLVRKFTPNHPQIMFNGTLVAKVNDQKHLSFILYSSLSFKKHLNEKIIKAERNLGIIKHLSIFLPQKTLDLMYKAFVRSHLDYCDIIYHIPSKQTQLGMTLNVLMEKN